MLDSSNEELIHVEHLIDEAKFGEAFELLKDLEKEREFSPKDQLSTLLLKGIIYRYKHQFRDTVNIGEQAYQMSLELEDLSGTIWALFLKARILYLGEYDNALENILEAEEIINSLEKQLSLNIQRQKAEIVYLKSWIHYFKGDMGWALESAETSLLLAKKSGNKLELANNYLLLGHIYWSLQKLNISLDYAMKSLDLSQELDCHPGIILSSILVGRVNFAKDNYNQAVKFAKQAYQLSQELGFQFGTIEVLFLKTNILWLREPNKALDYILEAQKLINLQVDQIPRQKASVLFLKSYTYLFKRDLDSALKSAEKSLLMAKKSGNKLEIASNYLLLGRIYSNLLKYDTALEYALKRLDLMNELDSPHGIHHHGIVLSLSFVGEVYTGKGEFNQALKFYKMSLSIEEISNQIKVENLILIGYLYYSKGELDRSLKYHNQALTLAREINADDQIATSLFHMGYVYRIKGEYEKSIKSQESSLALLEKKRENIVMSRVLLQLVLLHLDKGSREQAQKYLTRLKQISEHLPYTYYLYLLAKAMVLKTSGRTSKRAESEVTLRKIIEFDFIHPDVRIFALINLCDLYLEDLYLYNNLEILSDITPIISQMLKVAEERHSYFYLAETKLLQAKLALIQMNSTEAKKLLVEAQRIAEFNDFNLLGIKISSEHDKVLTQLDIWNDFKKKNTPISERVKFASINEVIDQIQRKRAVDPPELVDEQSTLLLIIAEGGVLIFSYPFTVEWQRDDELFSSFLSAFTSFSDEFFSEGLDRVKFGQYTVLLESVNPFSVCYLYKGQTYPAKQKLTKFIESIQNSEAIWKVLEKFYMTSQVLEIEDIPSLESLITEIFITKSLLPSQSN
jgi:tetratricopeptide (TPR) repeat protein